MIGEPPNRRTVQRDDLRIAQLRGDWSQRRSSTIIPSPVHMKLIKHPISMVPLWKFPTSTMVSFRVCFLFLNGGRDCKKKTSLSIQDEAHCSRRIPMQRTHQYFADIWDHFWGVDIRVMTLLIINLIIIKYFWSNHRLYIIVILTCILPVAVIPFFLHKFHHQSSSQFTPHASGSQFFPGQHP